MLQNTQPDADSQRLDNPEINNGGGRGKCDPKNVNREKAGSSKNQQVQASRRQGNVDKPPEEQGVE